MVLNAFIVDDEQQTRNTLQALLQEFCPEVTIRGTAGSIEEAGSALSGQPIDILFLDIDLGDHHTGFDLLDRLKPYEFDVVFVTAHDGYALKAFEYEAVHYLLKPVSHNELRDTVARVRKRKERSTTKDLRQLTDALQRLQPVVPKVALTDTNKTEFVPIDEITYLESSGSYTVFHLKDKRHFVRSKNLKHFEDTFAAYPQFIRVHKSYIVNRDQVRAFRKNSQELELVNGATVPVAIGYRNLLEQLGQNRIL